MDVDRAARQHLLDALRADGSDAALAQAAQLGEIYHAREMAVVSRDVYDSAREADGAHEGWKRGSENPELLRRLLPELDETTLKDLLKPEASGFRAEIYLPDPEVLGPGYKPTLVFKGSTGQVVEPDGALRDTSIEDFLGNNFPQSIGMKTDYYDRAMDIALELKDAGLDFDIAGHSLAGGKAAAASAVTGMRAFTFNAAGLHPATASRFSSEHGDLPLYDTRETVTAWEVQGEVLNAGVQGDLRGMSALHRERMALLLSNAADVMQHTPVGRDYIEQRLIPSIPEDSRPAAKAFLDRLAQGDVAELIRDMPEAAGARKPPLMAMSRQEMALVERANAASLGELQLLGGPVLTVATMGMHGANHAARVGQVVATAGDWTGNSVEQLGGLAGDGISGTGYRVERMYASGGRMLEQGAQAIGEVTAHARMAGAQVEAAIDHGQGWAQYNLARLQGGALRGVAALGPDAWRDALETRAGQLEVGGAAARDRQRGQAADAMSQGQAEAEGRREAAGWIGERIRSPIEAVGTMVRDQYVYVGERLDSGAQVVGSRITTITSHAPMAGAALGGTTGMVAGGTVLMNPGTPWGSMNVTAAIELVQEGRAGVGEAVHRHGMAVVIPSLDHHIQAQEQVARALLDRQKGQLQDQVTQQEGDAKTPASAGRSPASSPGGLPALDQLMEACKNGDAQAIARANADLLQTSAAKQWFADGQARLADVEREQVSARGNAPLPDAADAQNLGTDGVAAAGFER